MGKSATNLLNANAERYGRGEFVAKVYPSGDFTIGRSQPLKRDRHDYDPLDGITKDGFGIANESRSPEIEADGLELWKIAESYEKAGNEALAEHFGRSAGDVLSRSSLGLSVASISHRPRKKKGSLGITPQNKRFVKSGAVILEKEFGKKNVCFGTATLPALSQEDLETVCVNWSDLVRKFFQSLTRLLERRGVSTDYLFVTEIQEKRYEAWHQVCPHLHWISQSRASYWSDWAASSTEISALWNRQLVNLLGKQVDSQFATRVESPRKSLSKEVGKYLSKGGKLIRQIVQDGCGHYLPTAYVGMSRSLRAKIKRSIAQLTGDQALNFIDSLEAMSRAGLLCFRPICLEYAGRTITVGWVGFIKDESVQIALVA